MIIPKSVKNMIEAFERLPGIGPKSAARLTFYLLHMPEHEVLALSEAVSRLKTETVECSTCCNVAESDPCPICSSSSRDCEILAVVETPLDALALERAGFRGLYHVLHGVIDPLNNIGPEELRIGALLRRTAGRAVPSETRGGLDSLAEELSSPPLDVPAATNPSDLQDFSRAAFTTVSSGTALPVLREIILATNPTVEGEATAMYIKRELENRCPNVKITRLARGLPVGGDLEYADDVTLGRALEGRREF